jgi:hypothetical protein
MQQADRADRPRRVARAKDRGDQSLPRLIVEGQRRHERHIALVIVEPSTKSELLGAERLVLRDMEVVRNQPDAALPPPVPRNHGVGARVARGQ